MTELNARIKPKASGYANDAPGPLDLEVAEIALNTADKVLYSRHVDGSVIVVGLEEAPQDGTPYARQDASWISVTSGGGGTSSLVTRESVAETTASLAAGSAGDLTFSLTGSAGFFLSVQSSHAAWVTFYSSSAARTADAARSRNTDPGQSSGVLVDLFFDQAETLLITPSVLYFNEGGVDEIYAKVHNDETTAQAITITATVVPSEGVNTLSTGDVEEAPNDGQQYARQSEGWVVVASSASTIDDLTDVDTSTTPPTDGQVLTWVNANSQWEPAGAVTGGITSIQDADDFELQPYLGSSPVGEWDFKTTYDSNMCSDNGKAQANTYMQLAFDDKNGVDHQSYFESLTSGTVLWFQLNDETPEQITMTGGLFTADTTNCRFYFQPLPTGTASLTDNDTIRMWTTNPNYVPDSVSLADGDYLEWSANRQAFMPIQLATVAKTGSYNDLADQPTIPTIPVDSVNGETGVVSLGIQDMDDYQPEYQTSFTYLRYTRKGEINPGGISYTTQSGSDGTVANPTDEDGASFTSFFQNFTDGDSVWYSTDDGQTWSSTTATRVGVAGIGNTGLLSDDLYTAVFNLSPFIGQIRLALVDPDNLPALPPNDGEALVWDGDLEKFAPTGLATVATSGSYNDLTDQPTIVNQIQDQTDFALNLVPVSGNTYSSSTQVTDTGAAGYARYATNFSNPKPFIINEVTSDATNLNTGLSALSAGDSFWWSFDGGLTNEEFVISSITSGVNGRWDLTPTSPPSGSWSSSDDDPFERGQDWVLYLSNPGGPVEDPLADGDYLRWDAVDSKFKPTQLSAAPVSSVNGETGVVSLGIQEMDDFALVVLPGTVTSNTSKSVAVPNSAGEWRIQAENPSFSINAAFAWHNTNAGMDAIGVGDSLTFQATGVSDVTLTVKTAPTADGNSIFVYLEDGEDWPAEWLSLPAGTAMNVVSSAFGNTTVPLAEDDVLKWDNTDGKFKPAQLPAAPVSSVNGETGVVSLGVQDMDDFELHPDVTTEYEIPGPSGSSVQYSGRYWIDTHGTLGNVFAWHGGDSWATFFDGQQIGDELQFITESNFIHTATVNQTVQQWSIYGDYLTFTEAWPQELLDANTNDEAITVRQLPVGNIPLADGDILRWEDVNSKFKPAQLSTVATSGSYNDLTDQPTIPAAAPVDSVNGETGTVSLGIQEMDDFQLIENAGPGYKFIVRKSGGTSPASGEVEVEENLVRLILSTTDADGGNRTADLGLIQTDYNTNFFSNLTLSAAGQTQTVTSATNVASSGTEITLDLGAQNFLIALSDGDELFVYSALWTNAPNPGYAQLADGDLLKWDSSASKFVPTSDYISLTDLKAEVAASASFADFQSRIAAL